MGDFAVIGMGRFGRVVARELAREGEAVLALDLLTERLDAVREEVDSVMAVDATDERAMAGLELARLNCAVVTIGSRAMEASLLTTAVLRELDVPRIVARAFDDGHARLLLAIGANEVINPEEEMGHRLALSLAHPEILGQARLGEESLAQVEAPESYVGQRLGELDFATGLSATILAIRRDGAVLTHPGDDEEVAGGDVLVLLAEPEAVRRLAAMK